VSPFWEPTYPLYVCTKWRLGLRCRFIYTPNVHETGTMRGLDAPSYAFWDSAPPLGLFLLEPLHLTESVFTEVNSCLAMTSPAESRASAAHRPSEPECRVLLLWVRQ